MWRVLFFMTTVLCIPLSVIATGDGNIKDTTTATKDDGTWFAFSLEDLKDGMWHTKHTEIFGGHVDGFNFAVLKAIDIVQAQTNKGSGYFTGITAQPPESPIGYPLSLFGLHLLEPPRSTSYCSGATYAAFIETLNLLYPTGAQYLSLDRFESLRMQEPDGGRRNDSVKFWGYWNADGFGNHFALVQYSGMGTVIKPSSARPGDFMNISWTFGGGHSVIFLGWVRNKNDKLGVAYWSSQTETNGCGDVVFKSVDLIKSVKIVRLTNPERIFNFNVEQTVTNSIVGDLIR